MKQILFTIILGCATVLVHGQQQNTAFFKYMAAGNKLLEAKDSLGAADAYIEAIEAAPNKPEPYEKVGEIYSNIPQRLYQKTAKTYLEQFIKLTTNKERKDAAMVRLKAVNQFLGLENAPMAQTPIQQTPVTPQKVVTIARPVDASTETPSQDEVQVDSTGNSLANDPFGMSGEAVTLTIDIKVPVTMPHDIGMMDSDEDDFVIVKKPIAIQYRNEATIAENGDTIYVTVADTVFLDSSATSLQEDVATSDTNGINVSEDATMQEDGFDPFAVSNIPTSQGGGQSTQSYVYNSRSDKLYNAYIWDGADIDAAAPLYKVHRLVETPLAKELKKQTEAANTTTIDGRWASTLRNSATHRELFLLNISVEGQKLEMQSGADAVVGGKASGLVGSFIKKTVESKFLEFVYEFSFTENSLVNVQHFLANQIQPYLGIITEHNKPRIKELRSSNNEPLNVRCLMSYKANAARSSIHGNLAVNVVITTSDESVIQVLEQTVPCTLYRVDDTYLGYDATKVDVPNLADDNQMVQEIQSKAVRNANDLNNLGYCYLNGQGIAKNPAKALSYFEDALKQGSKEAYSNLFLMYRNGWGMEKPNFSKALEVLAEARDNGVEDAWCISADLMLDAPAGDAMEAANWYNKIQKNNAYAMYRIAQMTANGIGLPQNTNAANSYYERSIAAGSNDAFYDMAKLIFDGTIKDTPTEAYNNAIHASQGGSTQAMQMLADMYLTGVCTRRDFRSGIKWLNTIVKTENNTLKGYKYVENK